MSINIIVGRPGSGKSYEAVAFHVIPALKEGRRIVTNLPLSIEHFSNVFGPEIVDLIEIVKDGFSKDSGVVRAFSLPEHFTGEEWRNESGQGPLFIIDECHFQYPRSARDKKSSSDLVACLEYFSMHRHYGHDILLMTQSLGKLNKDLRDMIQVQYLVSKHTAAGSDKTYTQKVLDSAGSRPTCLSQKVRVYDSSFFPFYKSHTLSDTSVNEAKASDIVPLWRRWWIWLSVVCILSGLPIVFSAFSSMFGSSSDSASSLDSSVSSSVKHSDLSAPSSSAAPVIAAPKSKPKKPPFSEFTITITGWSDSSYKDNSGKFHTQFEYYLNASSDGSYSFPIKISDLLMAGYNVRALGPCVLQLLYDNTESFLYCEGNKPKDDPLESSLSSLPMM